MFRRIFDVSISVFGVMPTPGSSKENIDGAGAKAEPKSADSKDSSKKEKPPPPRTPEEKYADLVKKYNDLVANYKARGVAGDELRARLTQVEEELVEENERFQETEYRLKKANDEIEVLTAFGPRRGEEGEEEEEEGGVSDDFIMAASVSGANKIPKFRAEGEDGNKAALWLSNLDAIAVGHKWSEGQTLSNAILALDGDAAEWRWSQKNWHPQWFEELAAFKIAFRDRFCKAKTAVEAVRITAGLKQKQGESVRTYFDRCSSAVWLSSEDDLGAAKEDWAKEKKSPAEIKCLVDAYTRHLMWSIKCSFVNGLKSGVRNVVEAKFSDLDTQEKLIKAAVEAETATSSVESNRISELEAELNALRLQGGGPRFSGGGRGGYSTRGGRAGNRGSYSNRGGGQQQASAQQASQQQAQPQQQQSRSDKDLPHRFRVALRTEWKLCYKCGQWGKHLANECKYKPKQIAAMVRHDQEPHPAGPPVDPSFDDVLALLPAPAYQQAPIFSQGGGGGYAPPAADSSKN